MPSDDPPPSHDEIMAATHRAVCEHGYADLSMRKIAAESDKSHSLLTYHYDTKANLVEAYLDYLLDYLEQYTDPEPSVHPLDRVEAYLDYYTVGSEHLPQTLKAAFLELQMVALRDDDFQAKFRAHRGENLRMLADILRDGVERGVLRADLDVDAMAKLVLTSVVGASSWQATSDDPGLAADVRRALRDEVYPVLLTEDADWTPARGRDDE